MGGLFQCYAGESRLVVVLKIHSDVLNAHTSTIGKLQGVYTSSYTLSMDGGRYHQL